MKARGGCREKYECRDMQAFRVQPLGCRCPNTQAKACTLNTCNSDDPFSRQTPPQAGARYEFSRRFCLNLFERCQAAFAYCWIARRLTNMNRIIPATLALFTVRMGNSHAQIFFANFVVFKQFNLRHDEDISQFIAVALKNF